MQSSVPTETVKQVLKLYYDVLSIKAKECFDPNSINNAIHEIRKVYAKVWKAGQTTRIPYEEKNFRYGYIYYFGTLHTLSVINQIAKIKEKYSSFFVEMMGYDKRELNICSLGAGPGCDLIGLLIARNEFYGLGITKEVNCYAVDICEDWEKSMQTVFDTYLKSSWGKNYRKIKVQYELIRSNLIHRITLPVWKSVEEADILSLVKFVSLLPCENITGILKHIFRGLKPGAFVFFMDGCIKGEHEKVSMAAKLSGLSIVCPIKHNQECFKEDSLSSIGLPKPNVAPLQSTLITIGVWKKSRN